MQMQTFLTAVLNLSLSVLYILVEWLASFLITNSLSRSPNLPRFTSWSCTLETYKAPLNRYGRKGAREVVFAMFTCLGLCKLTSVCAWNIKGHAFLFYINLVQLVSYGTFIALHTFVQTSFNRHGKRVHCRHHYSTS
jgi:hypothetical protein